MGVQMPHYSIEDCRAILTDTLKMPRDSDLSASILRFQQRIRSSDPASAKGDRIFKILLELAAELEGYEPDPVAREVRQATFGELPAMEKIRETLDALENIEKVMPWLQRPN